MGLFFEILSSINNPNQSGSIEQLGSMMKTVQGLSDRQGMNMQTTQTILSAMSDPMRTVLKQQSNPLTQVLGQFVGGNSTNAMQSLFPATLQNHLATTIARKTGLDPQIVQTAIPMLIPVVMNLLNMGANSQPGQRQANSILTAFMEGDRSDLGNVFKFAGRFLGPVAA